MSLSDVEAASGVSRYTVWCLESGRTKSPHPKTIRRLAECYGVTPDEFRAARAAEVSS